MKRDHVKMFLFNKDDPSASQHIEAEAYVVDTRSLHDLDNLFKEVYRQTHKLFEQQFDKFMAEEYDEYWPAWRRAWNIAIHNMTIVTDADWRHIDASKPPEVSPAKNRNGEYLPLDDEAKEGCFWDALITRGNAAYCDEQSYQYLLAKMARTPADINYFKWLRRQCMLNYNNIVELNDQIIV